ncbi:MAG: hypothetical protein ACLFR8_05250 [Alkalispirochaeta sp.]
MKKRSDDARTAPPKKQRVSSREAAERYLPRADAVAIASARIGAADQHDPFRSFLGDLLLLDSSATATVTGTDLALTYSDGISRWLTDPRIVYEFLVGGITGGPDSLGAPRRRPVEVARTTTAEIRADAEAGRLWVCRIEWREPAVVPRAADGDAGVDGEGGIRRRADGDGGIRRVGWLVRETLPGADGAPAKSLARGLQRLKSGVEAMGLEGCRVGIARQRESSVDRAGALLRIGTDEWEAFWPVDGVHRLARALAAPSINDGGRDEPLRAEQTPTNPVGGNNGDGGDADGVTATAALAILAAEIRANGVIALAYHVPRTPEERLSVHAIRTIAALIDAGGGVVERFVDSVYRSGRRFRAFTVLYRFSGTSWQRRFDRALGERRRAQLPPGPIPIRSEFAHPLAPGEVWRTVASAVEELVGEYARNARRRGMALDARSMSILSRWYLHPRSDAMRRVWERSRKDTTVTDRLENGRLSILRDLARGIPRRVLVDAATGRDERTKRRLSIVFSRRGRRLFLEDVDAREAAIARNEVTDWEQILAAHRRLHALAQRLLE